MAIVINGKVKRNLQEQVHKNQDDIEDLKESVAQLANTTYSKEQVDNKDAEVLTEAKAYTYSKSESDEKFATITGVNTALESKFDKFVPTAGDIAGIELYDEEEYASLMIGVKNEGDLFYSNYVNVSGDGSVNIKATDTFSMGVQNNSGGVLFGKDYDMEFRPQLGYDVNFKVGNLGKVCVTQIGAGTSVKKEIALKEDIVPIIPNPVETATATLNKVTIGSTVYSVAGSDPVAEYVITASDVLGGNLVFTLPTLNPTHTGSITYSDLETIIREAVINFGITYPGETYLRMDIPVQGIWIGSSLSDYYIVNKLKVIYRPDTQAVTATFFFIEIDSGAVAGSGDHGLVTLLNATITSVANHRHK